MRRQLPAYSPITLRALLGGVAGALGSRAVVQRVGRALGERCDALAVIGTDSGTTALRLALAAVADPQGRRPIALPAYGCYDLATAAVGAGVPVVLYDVDPATLGPDPDDVRALCARGACAVVVAHLFGYPVDMRAVNAVAAEAGVPVIEDAAQGADATLDGRRLGTWGSLVVLSFGRGKGMMGGRGGALLARDPGARAALGKLAPFGPEPAGWGDLVRAGAVWVLGRPWLYGVPARVPWLALGQTVYRLPHQPSSWSKAAAGILAGTLPLAAGEAAARRAIGSRIAARLPPRARCGHAPPPGADPGYLRVPALAPSPQVRARLVATAASVGLAEGYPRSLADLAPLRPAMVNPDAMFPGARLLADRLCTLPTHSRLARRDTLALERLIDREF